MGVGCFVALASVSFFGFLLIVIVVLVRVRVAASFPASFQLVCIVPTAKVVNATDELCHVQSGDVHGGGDATVAEEFLVGVGCLRKGRRSIDHGSTGGRMTAHGTLCFEAQAPIGAIPTQQMDASRQQHRWLRGRRGRAAHGAAQRSSQIGQMPFERRTQAVGRLGRIQSRSRSRSRIRSRISWRRNVRIRLRLKRKLRSRIP